MRGPGPPDWGSLESETVKYGHDSRETRTWEGLSWGEQAEIVNDRPILSLERTFNKDYDRKCSVEQKITGRAKTNWLAVNRLS
jgi:hypothetical protein